MKVIVFCSNKKNTVSKLLYFYTNFDGKVKADATSLNLGLINVKLLNGPQIIFYRIHQKTYKDIIFFKCTGFIYFYFKYTD